MSDLGERLASAYPQDASIETWKINNRVTTFLLENLPDKLWPEAVPGAPRRTGQIDPTHPAKPSDMSKLLVAKFGRQPPLFPRLHAAVEVRRSGGEVDALSENGHDVS